MDAAAILENRARAALHRLAQLNALAKSGFPRNLPSPHDLGFEQSWNGEPEIGWNSAEAREVWGIALFRIGCNRFCSRLPNHEQITDQSHSNGHLKRSAGSPIRHAA
jgi:hypothetical protein